MPCWGNSPYPRPLANAFSSSEYAAGTTTSVSSVELTIPPITATAKGPLVSAPAPKPNEAGSVASYAARRGVSVAQAERDLAPNLGY